MSKFAGLAGIVGEKIFGSGGGGGFNAAKTPPQPLPKRTDPEIESTRKRQLQADKLRKGRRAAILTSPRGVKDELGSVSRPQARGAQLLGE